MPGPYSLVINEDSQFTERILTMPSGVPVPFPGGAQSISVVLNGSGNGIVSLGPQRVKEHWQVVSAGVKVSSNVAEAQCSIYIGVPGALQQQFFGQTYTGSTGDTCGIDQDIQPGQVVTAQWTGGDAAATATLTLFGTYTTGAPLQ
jgi:hypothetical protein